MGKQSRVAVFAFGTRGDVLPVAVVAAALARADPSLSIAFITHEAHRNMEPHLARSGVARFVAVAAPPVVPGRAWEDDDDDEKAARDAHKALDAQIREECVAAMDSVMTTTTGEAACEGDGDGGSGGGAVMINLFALEGWHLAELYRLPCAVLAPYVVPYSAPSAFERRFRLAHPLLYRRLKEAAPGEVGWEEVTHWMWPLFTERWVSWRTQRLHLSACPLADPVTDLPLLHAWPRASPLLYGFSPQVVECPPYWPRSVRVCGFWFAPLEWEIHDVTSELLVPQTTTKKPLNPKTSHLNPKSPLLNPVKNKLPLLHTSFSTSEDPSLQTNPQLSNLGGHSEAEVYDTKATGEGYVINPEVLNGKAHTLETFQTEQNYSQLGSKSYNPPVKLCQFISNLTDSQPIFVGMSSVGSMGYLEKPGLILKLINAVLEATSRSGVLLTSGYPPLDLAVCEQCDETLAMQGLDTEQQNRSLLLREEGLDTEQQKKRDLLRASFHEGLEGSRPDFQPPILQKSNSSGPKIGGCFLNSTRCEEDFRISSSFCPGQPGSGSDLPRKLALREEGLSCFNGRLFCYSGSVPYEWLLPKCCVVIHHGGSGTTAACLRAGVVQIICPFVLDQFYWAERMAWLGVAPQQQPLLARHLMPEECEGGFVEAVIVVAGAVREALSAELQGCACALSAKLAVEDGTAVAVGVLRAMLFG